MPFQRPENTEISREKRRIFVGRTGELEFFMQHILEADTPMHNIVVVSGNTGAGKSSLLAQFAELADTGKQRDYCLVARVGEQQVTPIGIMEKFAQQLDQEGKPLVAFEAAVRSYKERIHTTPVRHESILGRNLERPERILFDEVSFEDEKWTGDNHEAHTFDDPLEQGIRWNEQIDDPTSEITAVFVEDLNRVANTPVIFRPKQQRRILLFFDQFEQMANEVVPWLLHNFLEEKISPNVVLVIAGIMPLERAVPQYARNWLSYRDEKVIYSITLNSFSREETRQYLEEHNIVDKERIETFWKLSRGLPLYLCHLVANPQQNLDPAKDVVEAILSGISGNEEMKRRLALDVALFSKAFNQDDLEALAYIVEEDRAPLYQWLSGQSFVNSNPLDGRYSYHELTREMFSRYLYQSPKQYQATRRGLARYYKHLLEETPIKANRESRCSAEWLELALALITQLLFLPERSEHIHVIEQTLLAYSHTDREQDREIVKVLSRFFQEKPGDQVSTDARQVALRLCDYIMANVTKQGQKLLDSSTYLLEQMASMSVFSGRLQAEIYVKRSQVYYLYQGKNEEALRECNLALECDADYLPAHLLRGVIYNNLNRQTEALVDFERANNCNEDASQNARILFHLGQTSRLLGLHEQALSYLEEALELKNDNDETHAEVGLTLYSLGRYQEAIDAFNKAIVKSPETSFYWISLAKTYRAVYLSNEIPKLLETTLVKDTPEVISCWGEALSVSGHYEKALEAFTRAIALNPQKSIFFVKRANVYKKMIRYEDALSDLTRAIVLKPDNVTTLTLRGGMYGRLGRYDEALQDFRHALQMKRKNGETFLERGIVYRKMNNQLAALQDFDRAIELDPETEHTAQEEKGLILHKQDKYQEAIEAYTKSLNKYMQCKRCWVLLAESHRRFSTYEEIPERLRAISLPEGIAKHEIASIIAYRAEAERAIGHSEEALLDLERALELDENNAFALLTRGITYRQTELYEEALVDFTEIMRFDLDYAHDGYKWIGETLLAMEKYKEASENFTQALIVRPFCERCWGSLLRTYEALYTHEKVPDLLRQTSLQEDEKLLLARGNALHQAGYWEEAVSDFTQAIDLSPENADVFLARGESLLTLRHFEEALLDFQHVLELQSRNVKALLGRGEVYHKLAQYSEAMRDFDQVSVIAPNRKHDTFKNRGKVFLSQGKYIKASEAFIKALKCLPTNRQCWELLIKSYEALYSHEKILKSVRSVDISYANIAKVMAIRASALRERGYYRDALEEIEQASKVKDAENGYAHSTRGLIFSSLGKYAQAIESFQQELQEKPEHYKPLYNIAVTMICWRGADSAQESIEKAYAVFRKELYRANRGAILYALGGIEAALGHIEKALDYLLLAILHEDETISWARHDIGWLTLHKNQVFQELTNDEGQIYAYFALKGQDEHSDDTQPMTEGHSIEASTTSDSSNGNKEDATILPTPGQANLIQEPVMAQVDYLTQTNRSPESMSQQDIARLVEILARLAANSFEGSRLFFRGLIARAEVPRRWVQEAADVWTGNANHDADKLIRWSISKKINPDAPQYTTLGSILKMLLPEVGLEDARTIAASMVVYQLCLEKVLKESLAIRYQLPLSIMTNSGQVAELPVVWLGPSPEKDITLQSWLRPEPDLLDVGLIIQAGAQAAGICRIELPKLGRMGTGFLIAPRLALTNYHVLKGHENEDLEENARQAILRFGCTSANEGQVFRLAEAQPILRFSSTGQRDYVLMQIEEAITQASEIRALQYSLRGLDEHMGLHILQHPEGGTMKLAIHSNGVTHLYPDGGLVHYVTRAKEGSSGSPCFNEAWEVVAVHRAEQATSFGRVREGILFRAIYEEIKEFL